MQILVFLWIFLFIEIIFACNYLISRHLQKTLKKLLFYALKCKIKP